VEDARPSSPVPDLPWILCRPSSGSSHSATDRRSTDPFWPAKSVNAVVLEEEPQGLHMLLQIIEDFGDHDGGKLLRHITRWRGVAPLVR
jgi:hypothetical protein